MPKAKILTMPAPPDLSRVPRHHTDARYIEGQRLLVEAIRYLVQSGLDENLDAVELLSEHFRTRFRSTDRPHLVRPQATGKITT
jgi:hypothetical protein